MIIKTYETNEEWMADRPGKITGSKLNDTHSARGGTKTGVYQLIADKLNMQNGDDSSNRDRGHLLEVEAVETLGKQIGVKFKTELEMWFSDEDPDMAFSPDGYNDDYTIAAEAKCLSSALHIEAVVTNKIPYKHRADYHAQRVQAFIVNEKLQEHYTIFYDPRITARPYVILKITREEAKDDIEYFTEHERATLEFVNEWVERLSF